jgi:hypothetical protein
MATYIKFELEDGTAVYMETTDVAKGSSGLLPSTRGTTEQASISFEKSVDAVRKMAVAMLNNLREGFTEQPEEVQINFGLKGSAELGNLVVARSGMESNYNVMLRWRKDSDKEEK